MTGWWCQSHLVSELLSPLTLDWMSLAVSLPTLPDIPSYPCLSCLSCLVYKYCY